MPRADEPGREADEPPGWLFDGDPDAPPTRGPAARHPVGWPGWGQLVLTLIAALLILWYAAVPGGSLVPGVLSTLFGVSAGLWWLGRVGAASLDVARHRVELPTRAELARWLLAPALAGIVAVLLWQDVPVRTAFALSRGSFETVLARPEPIDVADSYAKPRDVGLYSGYVRYEGSTVLVDVGWLGGAGFAHLDGPAPPGIELGPSLGDGWYVFEEPFSD
ncbi:MAG: hypothetical protein R3C15_13535 [Thermoleophilia bacterium]